MKTSVLDVIRGCLSSILIQLGFKIAPNFYMQQLLGDNFHVDDKQDHSPESKDTR